MCSMRQKVLHPAPSLRALCLIFGTLSTLTFQKGTGVVRGASFQATCHKMGCDSSPVTLVTGKIEERLVVAVPVYPELYQTATEKPICWRRSAGD